MVDVYFPNGVFLLLPLIESLLAYWSSWKEKNFRKAAQLFTANASFLVVAIVVFIPTLVTRWIIFGGILRFGTYGELAWDWTAPYWRSILFSAEHGLFTWTPILALSVAGLFFAPRAAKSITSYLGVGAAAYYYLISSYPSSPDSSPPNFAPTSSAAKPSCSRSRTATSSSSKKILQLPKTFVAVQYVLYRLFSLIL